MRQRPIRCSPRSTDPESETFRAPGDQDIVSDHPAGKEHSGNQSINQSIDRLIDQSINQSINQSIDQKVLLIFLA